MTRLIPTLGNAGAAELHAELARRMVGVAVDARLAPVEIHCYPDEHDVFFAAWGDEADVVLRSQVGNDLGERMANAFASCLASQEVNGAVLVGTDCPAIDAHFLEAALALLEAHDAVIGPAEDGGYGLIGLVSPDAGLFADIDWGTSRVCAETCRKFNERGLYWSLMPRIWDVDRPADVERYRSVRVGESS